MIVASSMSLLLDSRLGRRGGVLPWTLLIIGAAASLSANIAVAEPTLLLMRQVRHAAHRAALTAGEAELPVRAECEAPVDVSPEFPATSLAGPEPVAAPGGDEDNGVRRVVQRRAWQWALANRRPDGSLPAGTEVARQFGRSDRWGRLVTCLGRASQLAPVAES